MLITQFGRQRVRTTVSVLLAAFVLRMILFAGVLVMNPAGFFETDSREYWRIAENLVEHGNYSLSIAPPLVPDHKRTPLYPLFIAAFRCLRLDAAVIVAAQIALSLLAVLAAMEMTEKLFGNGRAAAWAGVLMSADVPSIVFAGSLLTESVFTTLFALGVLLSIESYFHRKPGYLAAGAVVLGLAALCRPVALFFPGALLAIYLVADRAPWRLRIGRTALFLGLFLLTLAPWVGRNYATFGRPFLSTIGDVNMLEYRAAAVYAKVHRVSLSDAGRLLREQVESTYPGSKDEDPIAFSRHGAKVGRRVILDHPWIYLSNSLRAALSLLFAPLRSSIDLQLGLSERGSSLQHWGQAAGRGIIPMLLENTSGPTLVLVLFQLLHLLILWALLIIGAADSIRSKNLPGLVLVFVVVIYFLVVSSGPEAYARFRVPLMPFLAALAGWGAATLRHWKRRKKPGQP
jgi:4-amino-4-deoxy-L-arabinose transferase-like glycosyltransferase